MKRLEVTSVFQHNGIIPIKYTCDGEDVNPPFKFRNIPKSAKSLALIMEDPDAVNVWTHWLVWNIPPNSSLEEDNVPGVEGLNDFKRQGYGGPCPAKGQHRYFYKIYALDKMLDIPPASIRSKLESAMENHILSKGILIGRYARTHG